jgi:hypothetical protein
MDCECLGRYWYRHLGQAAIWGDYLARDDYWQVAWMRTGQRATQGEQGPSQGSCLDAFVTWVPWCVHHCVHERLQAYLPAQMAPQLASARRKRLRAPSL